MSENKQSDPVVWHQGALVTLNNDPYPKLGEWFVQFWEGEQVAARVYGNDREELNRRCNHISTHPTPIVAQEPVGYFSINDYGRWQENEGNFGEPLYAQPASAVAVNEQLLEICKKLWRESEWRSRHKAPIDPDFVLTTIGSAIATAEAEKKRSL